MFIKVSDLKSAEEFKNQTNNGYWVILYYADWCPHCVSMKPEWKMFADKYSSDNKINVAELESQFLDMVGPEHKSNVEGFPTIISLNKGSKVANFMGPRTNKDIDMFANSHYTGVKGITNKFIFFKNVNVFYKICIFKRNLCFISNKIVRNLSIRVFK
jgi:thiol-disulfide isomerase/thioredoxin